MRPHVDNAPGITWRPKGEGWEAIWRARPDLIQKGFRPKNHRLWSGTELSEVEAAAIADTCRRLQDEMLIFGRGGLPSINAFDGTLKALVNCYQTVRIRPTTRSGTRSGRTTTSPFGAWSPTTATNSLPTSMRGS